MKIYLFLVIAAVITAAGCGGNLNKLVGNIYLHEEGPAKQYVGFYQDSMIFKWQDEMGTEVFTTPYHLTQLDDSTYNIEVMNKHKWMPSSSWKIVMDKNGGFYSMDSKKKYVLNNAPMIR
jgi:hypothetical protein